MKRNLASSVRLAAVAGLAAVITACSSGQTIDTRIQPLPVNPADCNYGESATLKEEGRGVYSVGDVSYDVEAELVRPGDVAFDVNGQIIIMSRDVIDSGSFQERERMADGNYFVLSDVRQSGSGRRGTEYAAQFCIEPSD